MPKASNYPLEKVRASFPMLAQQVNGHPYIYLDTAATAQKPQAVIDAITSFYSSSYATVNRAIYTLSKRTTSEYWRIRENILKFLGATEDYTAVFTSGTTESINLISRSFVSEFLKPKDEVIVFSSEHHSNLIPWQMAQQRGDIALKVLPILSSGDIDLDLFKQALTARTKLVSFAHMSNVTGAVHPAKEICEICQSREIYTLVDGAQSAGHIPVNVAEIGCDFFTFSGHKLYGPTGIGVLVGKKSLLSKMPPMFGGGDMIESVSFEGVKYADIPQKFEAGTPRIAQVFGLGAAIDFLSSFGLEAIKAHEQMLMDFLTEELEKVTGLTLIGNPKRRTSIISFILDGIHSLDLASLLDTKGIAVRSGHLCAEPFLESLGTPYVTRISLGIYTTLDEIKKTIFELRNLLENLL